MTTDTKLMMNRLPLLLAAATGALTVAATTALIASAPASAPEFTAAAADLTNGQAVVLSAPAYGTGDGAATPIGDEQSRHEYHRSARWEAAATEETPVQVAPDAAPSTPEPSVPATEPAPVTDPDAAPVKPTPEAEQSPADPAPEADPQPEDDSADVGSESGADQSPAADDPAAIN